MRRALKLARSAGECGEVPVGAVVVDSANNVLGAAANTRHATGDYAGHAEIIALNQAAKTLQNRVLEGCKLFITLEPCVMCAGAILASRVPQVIFAAWDHKAGAVPRVAFMICCERGCCRILFRKLSAAVFTAQNQSAYCTSFLLSGEIIRNDRGSLNRGLVVAEGDNRRCACGIVRIDIDVGRNKNVFCAGLEGGYAPL